MHPFTGFTPFQPPPFWGSCHHQVNEQDWGYRELNLSNLSTYTWGGHSGHPLTSLISCTLKMNYFLLQLIGMETHMQQINLFLFLLSPPEPSEIWWTPRLNLHARGSNKFSKFTLHNILSGNYRHIGWNWIKLQREQNPLQCWYNELRVNSALNWQWLWFHLTAQANNTDSHAGIDYSNADKMVS